MKEKLINEILKDEWMLDILKSVRDLNLPDCWIGAGFVRSKAWDLLHGYTDRTPLTDVDVIFLDKKNITVEYEREIETKLKATNLSVNWEVRNQARTHLWHHSSPYKSTEEAISHWVETATCIGIRILNNNKLDLIAPHGLNDVESLLLKPVPSLKNIETFNKRIKAKDWLNKWPKLKIITP